MGCRPARGFLYASLTHLAFILMDFGPVFNDAPLRVGAYRLGGLHQKVSPAVVTHPFW